MMDDSADRSVLPSYGASLGRPILGAPLQFTHLVSLCLVVLAMALLMTPAAYDRIAEPRYVSEKFLKRTICC